MHSTIGALLIGGFTIYLIMRGRIRRERNHREMVRRCSGQPRKAA